MESKKSVDRLIGVIIFLLGICFGVAISNLDSPNKQSSIYNDNSIITSSLYPNVIISNQSSIFINSLYRGSVQEVSFCLYGYTENETIYVVNITEARMANRSYNGVISFLCDGSIGTMHTHPSKIGKFSEKDLFSFGYDYAKTGSYLFGVIYNENKYLFYTSSNIGNALNYTIKG